MSNRQRTRRTPEIVEPDEVIPSRRPVVVPLHASPLEAATGEFPYIELRFHTLIRDAHELHAELRTALHDTAEGPLQRGYVALAQYPYLDRMTDRIDAALFALQAGVSPRLVVDAVIQRARVLSGYPATGACY